LAYPAIKNEEDFKNQIDCKKDFTEFNPPPGVDWSSPSWILAALNHCFITDEARSTIHNLMDEKSMDTRYSKQTDLDALIRGFQKDAERVRVSSANAVLRLRQAAQARGFMEFLKDW
jgi:hypothetical protein